MKNQIIVSIVPISADAPIRQHGWISKEGDNLGDIVGRLKVLAQRDMNFNIEEAELMAQNVTKAFNSGFKAVTVDFNGRELLSICVMDEAAIQARSDMINELFNHQSDLVH